MSSQKYTKVTPGDEEDEVERVDAKASELIEARLTTTSLECEAGNPLRRTLRNQYSVESQHNPVEPKFVTFELPRDILTAYIIIRLENDGKTGLWSKYSTIGKVGIVLALLTPFTIQYTVAITLITEIDWRDANKITDVDGLSVWYNLISLAVLFIYMFRDIHGYSANVWRFIGRVEEEQKVQYNPLHRSRLANIGHIFKRWDYHVNVDKQWLRLLFIEFRILIIAVFLLYAMLTFYSLIQIAVTDGLADKLEVSLSIFFLLEVDDWSYDLFISQNHILDDEQFIVQFPLKIEDKDDKFARDIRNLWCSLWIVFGSLMAVMIYSFLYNPI